MEPIFGHTMNSETTRVSGSPPNCDKVRELNAHFSKNRCDVIKDSDDLKIVFWNAHSAIRKKIEIKELIQEVDIFICVESWLKPKNDFLFSGFKTFRKDRLERDGGGLVFLVRNNLAFHGIEHFKSKTSAVELAGIRVTNVNPQVDILCVYRVPGPSLSQSQWDDVFIDIIKDNHTLVVGDFNSHHSYWNCDKINTDGERLLASIDKFNLFLHNADTKTHLDSSNFHESNIDLIFSSTNLASRISVDVSDDTLGSDHYPINIKIDVLRSIYRKRSFNLKSKRTNWEKFNRDLDSKYVDFLGRDFSEASACDKYIFFFTLLSNVLKSCTPVKKFVCNSRHRNPAPWWDSDCEKAKRLKKAAFKKSKFTKKPADFIDYKRLSASARRLFRCKKRKNFRDFASRINFSSSVKYVWDTCKILKNCWIKIRPSHTSENHQDAERISDALDKLVPPGPDASLRDPGCMPTFNCDPFLDAQFNFFEFNVALESKNDGSACGMDGVDYSVLKRLPIKYKLILLDIFNEMYSSGEYPSEWNKSWIHFIGKSDGVGVRPISLISCTCKLFETLIKNKLSWWVEHNNVLPGNQAAFRGGHSTSDSLVGLTINVQEAFEAGKGLLGAFLDIDAAFPSVDPSILLQKLTDVGISGSVLNYVKFATAERRIYNDLLGDGHRILRRGLPQGGVLSPLLFNLYVRDICKGVPKSVTVLQFADDLAVHCRWGSLESSVRLLTKAIDVLYDNLRELRLKLNPGKTVLVYFNRRGVRPGSVSIRVRGTEVASSKSVKFLGVVFDYRLNFDLHVDKLRGRCYRALNIVRFLRGTWWGADPGTLLVLYKSFVRSILDYGSFVYFPTRKATQSRIEAIQYSAIRLALGLRLSTPRNLLLAESKLDRLSDRATFLGNKYLGKVLSNSGLESHRVILRLNGKINQERNRYKFQNRVLFRCVRQAMISSRGVCKAGSFYPYLVPYEALTYEVFVDTHMGSQLRDHPDPDLLLGELLLREDGQVWFTDGSKSVPQSVGCASRCPIEDITVTRCIDGRASIFTAESIALLDAVELGTRGGDRDVIVLSDSRSALMSLKSFSLNVRTNPYILEIKKIAYLFNKETGFSVKFYWVPAHCGVGGNEEVDLLAKNAGLREPDSSMLVPFTDLGVVARNDAFVDTLVHIISEGVDKGTHYVQSYFDSCRKPWFHGLGLPREIITTITRCRVGHYNLAASLAMIGVVDSPRCSCRLDEQDLNHVLWRCPLYDQQRLRLVNKLEKLNFFPPYNCTSLLCNPTAEICRILYKFFESCNLKI